MKRTLDGNCTACHNEQKTAGAPMSLKTYADLMAPAVSDKTKQVYQLVGVRVHDKAKPMPPQGQLVKSKLGYYLREGKHSMTAGDWKVFMDFADAQWRTGK